MSAALFILVVACLMAVVVIGAIVGFWGCLSLAGKWVKECWEKLRL